MYIYIYTYGLCNLNLPQNDCFGDACDLKGTVDSI